MLALRHAQEHRAFLDGPGARVAPVAAISARGEIPAAPRAALGHAEARELLREFGVPLADTVPVASADEAVRAAERLGYPVVLKIESPDIPHKTEVGGVRVGCADAGSVRHGFRQMLEDVRQRAPGARVDGVLVQRMVAGGTEMIVGIKRDPLFGPAVICGFGGVFVEVLHDVAVRVPPLDHEAATAMVSELRADGRACPRGCARPRGSSGRGAS